MFFSNGTVQSPEGKQFAVLCTSFFDPPQRTVYHFVHCSFIYDRWWTGLPYGRPLYGYILTACRTKTMTGWWLGHPSEKYEFVNWDDEIPNISGKIQKMATSYHQPAMSFGQRLVQLFSHQQSKITKLVIKHCVTILRSVNNDFQGINMSISPGQIWPGLVIYIYICTYATLYPHSIPIQSNKFWLLHPCGGFLK